jgi:hypothetical protein
MKCWHHYDDEYIQFKERGKGQVVMENTNWFFFRPNESTYSDFFFCVPLDNLKHTSNQKVSCHISRYPPLFIYPANIESRALSFDKWMGKRHHAIQNNQTSVLLSIIIIVPSGCCFFSNIMRKKGDQVRLRLWIQLST